VVQDIFLGLRAGTECCFCWKFWGMHSRSSFHSTWEEQRSNISDSGLSPTGHSP
jgi:hypothetical protein